MRASVFYPKNKMSVIFKKYVDVQEFLVKKYVDVQEFLVKHGSSDSEFQEHTNLQRIL